jgi:hypothetical protein
MHLLKGFRLRAAGVTFAPVSGFAFLLLETLSVSHIVQIETKMYDTQAVFTACCRLGLKAPVEGTAQLFSGSVTGLLVELPGWLYPVVIDTTSGTVRYDNYGGRWGEQRHLERLMQIYAVEKARLESRKRGHDVVEQALPDGSVKLTVTVGGAS